MAALPLEGVRVVDLADAVGEAATRLLADLGADTVKVEPLGGATTRSDAPLVDGVSLAFAMRNANKRGLTTDLGAREGRERVRRAITSADIVVATPSVAVDLDLDALAVEHAELVLVISSPFGRTGPRQEWVATDRTLYALSGVLSRSGRPGDAPLLPPDGLAQATAAAQLAWVALVAYLQRIRTGRGQVVDLSHHEAVVTGLDPAFGVQGSAAAGRSGKVRRDRPPADSYPIYRCADGYVRLCLLAKRQWRGMFAWLGEPAEFADPKFDSITARVQASDRLDSLIEDLFASQTAEDLVDEAARRGVPLAAVLTLGGALEAEHFISSGTVAKAEIAPGVVTAVPTGCVEIDGTRLGIRTPSPELGANELAWPASRRPAASESADEATLPFTGLRVLDLGVIVFGAEVGRLFADLGADVIKIESLTFPDGLRQTRGGEAMNASFAWGQRNKKSMGLDLRTDEGNAIFRRLAAQADVVLSNFKPGTLEALRIDRPVLADANRGIIVLESAAFHSRGPWARRLGYGPLVRAACGISSLWRYAAEDTECWDGVTVFPDHVAAKIAGITILAALIARLPGGPRAGQGGAIQIAQSDVVLHQLGALAALESLSPGAVGPTGNRGSAAFGGLFAADGDDEWCVVEARTNAELDALGRLVGTSDLEPTSLHRAVAAWVAQRSPHTAMAELQCASVPAAAMLRLSELAEDPQLLHRGTYTQLHHPALSFDLPTENVGAPYGQAMEIPLEPAPAVGEHTVSIAQKLLSIPDADISELIQRGILYQADNTES